MADFHAGLRRLSAVIIGVVFFVGGILKLMDPVGAGYVVTEYLRFFHVGFLSIAAKWIAFGMAMLESLVGLALIAGVMRRIVAMVASVLIGFFTLLTLILLIFNPEMDCGCFGEAVHLTHLQTFLKNLVLVALAALAFLPFKDYGDAKKSKYVAFALVAASTFVFAIYSQSHLPMMDFTAFAPGSELVAAQGNGSEEIDDYVATFVYEKNGQEGEFTLENLPDSTWTFVRTDTHPANGLAVDENLPVLSLRSLDGEYCDSLAAQGKVLIASVYNVSDMNETAWNRVSDTFREAAFHGISTILLSSGENGVPSSLMPFAFFSDYKTISTLNRSNGGYTYLSEGEIIVKWPAKAHIDSGDFDKIVRRNTAETMLSYSTRGRLTFQAIVLYSVAVLLLV